MTLTIDLPIVVLIINIIILTIQVSSLVHIVHKLRTKSVYRENFPWLIFMSMFTMGLFLVNTFSFLNHYRVYFTDDIQMSGEATVWRFADRYAMLGVTVTVALFSMGSVLRWISKWKPIESTQ